MNILIVANDRFTELSSLSLNAKFSIFQASALANNRSPEITFSRTYEIDDASWYRILEA